MKHAASDLLAFLEALLGIGVLLLALEEGHVLRQAARPDVLRRRRQHRRRRDRVSGGIQRRRHSGRCRIRSGSSSPATEEIGEGGFFNESAIGEIEE